MEKEIQLKTDADVEEILRLALRQNDGAGEGLRERLAVSAQELGISPDALAKAEEEWKLKKADEEKSKIKVEEFAEFRRGKMDDLKRHLTVYFIVNAFLVFINLLASSSYMWSLWSILGWGISIAIHVATVLSPNADNERREFEDWKRRRAER